MISSHILFLLLENEKERENVYPATKTFNIIVIPTAIPANSPTYKRNLRTIQQHKSVYLHIVFLMICFYGNILKNALVTSNEITCS